MKTTANTTTTIAAGTPTVKSSGFDHLIGRAAARTGVRWPPARAHDLETTSGRFSLSAESHYRIDSSATRACGCDGSIRSASSRCRRAETMSRLAEIDDAEVQLRGCKIGFNRRASMQASIALSSSV
jgi:hypothetical protein